MIITKPFHTPHDEKEKMRIYRHKGEVRGGNVNNSKKKYDEENQIADNEQKDFQIGQFD